MSRAGPVPSIERQCEPRLVLLGRPCIPKPSATTFDDDDDDDDDEDEDEEDEDEDEDEDDEEEKEEEDVDVDVDDDHDDDHDDDDHGFPGAHDHPLGTSVTIGVLTTSHVC